MSGERLVTLASIEEAARDQLDAGVFDYFAGGSGSEITLRENTAAFGRVRFRQRVLKGIQWPTTEVSILGRAAGLPMLLAPTALQKLAHPEGEVATATAARSANIPFCLATRSTCTIEEVADVGSQRWFQLYIHKDRDITRNLVERAAKAGYSAIVWTVDLTVTGYRERDLQNRFVMPDFARPVNFDQYPNETLLEGVGFGYDPGISWEDLAWLRSQSELPIVVKGIMTKEDAALAVEHGAAAVIVSNHGGRQLDQTQATLDVLEEVRDSVSEGVEIYLDGGVRRGSDIAIALALGARAVLIGRPYLWGLAAAGSLGVERVIEILKTEFSTTLALLGIEKPSGLNRKHLTGR